MKRFSFRLDSVLKYRDFQKTKVAGELAHAIRLRVNALEQMVQARETLQLTEKQLQVLLNQPAKMGELLMMQSGLVVQRESAQAALSAYEKAADEEVAARQRVLAAQRDYESMVSLKLKHRAEAQVELDKEEELAMDEFVRSRFQGVGVAT
jgi:flagellar export protein FliJ